MGKRLRAFAGRGDRRFLETVTILAYVLLLGLVSAFHEPWFDESQAWQIARRASLHDILFEIPHYEGHPPLWHLLLVPASRLGVPFEIGLKSLALLVAVCSCYLIVFRSPFPFPVRALLPFNFFLFYQYGVIARPYLLLYLILLALAMAFLHRDDMPVPFVCLLALLCLTHAYGSLFALGLSLAWVWDIVKEKGARGFFSNLLRDQRTSLLLLLLGLGIAVAAAILPRADTYNPALSPTTTLPRRLLYALLGMPADCLLVQSAWYGADRDIIQLAEMPAAGLFSTCVIGTSVWIAAFCVSTRRNVKYLILPYALFALFSGTLYLAAHHVGVCLELLVFWLWIALQDDDRWEGWRLLKGALSPTERDTRFLRLAGRALVAASLLIPLWWTAGSCWLEIREDYGSARRFSSFVKDHGLERAVIMTAWEYEETDEPDGGDRRINTCMVGDVASLSAYFDEGIIDNAPLGYLEYRVASELENEENRRNWQGLGTPELLLGKVDLEWVTGGEESLDDYSLVYFQNSDHIWKGTDHYQRVPVYLRKDLLDTYGVEELILSPADMFEMSGGQLKMTDELVASLKSGEKTIDEVLDEIGLGLPD